MYNVVSECVARARAGEGPSLIEALTYRLGAHTTADDPKKYRPDAELADWQPRDPLIRYRRFLQDRGLLAEAAEAAMREEIAADIQRDVETLDAMPPQSPAALFEHVYAEPTPQLAAQRAEFCRDLSLGLDLGEGRS